MLRQRPDADPRRGARRRRHEARRAPRAERRAARPARRSDARLSSGSALSATQRPLEEIGRFVSGGARDRARRRRAREGARPAGRRPARGHARAGRRHRPTGWPGGAQSIWPSIYPEMLELVREHRSTIVFVNNRRLAERLALRLNELAEEEIARAHHGSIAREQRVEIEELLKTRRDPVPRRHLVARARDRHGRRRPRDPGRVAEVGRARAAAHRPRRPRARRGLEGADLPEVPRRPARVGGGRAADAGRRDRGDGDPAQPARRARAADRRDLRRRGDRGRRAARARARRLPVRRPLARRSSRTCSTCSPAATRRTSSPSCGRGSSGTAPPASIRGRQGARRLAVTNAGTIPDRGLFGVHLVDGGGRVGELDEEMVYEARAGQTFLLGASTWRIEEITRDRVLVSPAPGVPGRGAVLEGRGRRPALRARARRSARPRASWRRCPEEKALKRLTEEHRLDERAAQNLLTFLPSSRRRRARSRPTARSWSSASATRSATGGSASSRRSARRVHAPWALALAARLRESLGLEVQSIWSDDGIALHLPDADAPPPIDDLLLDPDEIEELVVAGGRRHARSSARASARTRRGRC